MTSPPSPPAGAPETTSPAATTHRPRSSGRVRHPGRPGTAPADLASGGQREIWLSCRRGILRADLRAVSSASLHAAIQTYGREDSGAFSRRSVPASMKMVRSIQTLVLGFCEAVLGTYSRRADRAGQMGRPVDRSFRPFVPVDAAADRVFVR